MSKYRQFGLIGYPLTHSFSQRFFTEKFGREAIDAVYSNYEIADVSMLLQILAENPEIEGLNVTLPHKETVMLLLADMSDEAKAIGAVNVIGVSRDAGGAVQMKGYNSDVLGFMNSIEPMIDARIHKKALVLGTGGASKAVVYGLRKLGVEPQLVSRRETENTITYNEITEELLREYTVVVNCTPLGTFPEVEGAPEIAYEWLTCNHLLYDLVYNPTETKFLRKGKAQGARTKNGAEMLELQAMEAWKIWNK